MKKTLLYLLIASIFLHAESLDEEIEKLKKENELLELKQKNKQLSQDLQDGKIANDTTKNNDSDNTPIIKISKEESKSGFFIGLEGVIGSRRYLTYVIYLDAIKGGANFRDDTTSATFDGGLLFGGQKYFGQTQRHGIKLSVHIYSGFGYNYILRNQGKEFTHTLIPIKVGADLKYLWDFWDNKKHILGFNAGGGYEFDYYLGKFSAGREEYTRFGSQNSIASGGFYPTIGLHYIYNRHHQIELNYRFGGIFAMLGAKNIFDDIRRVNLYHQSYLTLNYAYRF